MIMIRRLDTLLTPTPWPSHYPLSPNSPPGNIPFLALLPRKLQGVPPSYRMKYSPCLSPLSPKNFQGLANCLPGSPPLVEVSYLMNYLTSHLSCLRRLSVSHIPAESATSITPRWPPGHPASSDGPSLPRAPG